MKTYVEPCTTVVMIASLQIICASGLPSLGVSEGYEPENTIGD